MTELEFGTEVLFSEPLVRETLHVKGKGTKKVWDRQDGFPKTKGIVVGKRTLSDGYREYEPDFGGYYYVRENSFTVYLVAYDMSRKPVYVRPESIEPIIAEGLLGSLGQYLDEG